MGKRDALGTEDETFLKDQRVFVAGGEKRGRSEHDEAVEYDRY